MRTLNPARPARVVLLVVVALAAAAVAVIGSRSPEPRFRDRR